MVLSFRFSSSNDKATSGSRSGYSRPPESHFLTRLQRPERAADLSRGGFVGADIDGGPGSFRHGQYEDVDEWRAHDRNAGRREH